MAARNVVVLGRTGDGKSTLCRCLASCLDISPEAARVFRESSGVISHTHDPVSCSADGNPGTGVPGTKVTDTPGLMDTNGVEKDEENISKIVRYVRALVSVNAFCLVVNEQADRFDSGMQDAVKLLVDSFGPTCMNNMGIVFTKAYGVISSEISRKRAAHIAELITKRTGFSVPYIPSWQIDCKPEEIATTFGLPQSEIAKRTTKRDDTLKEVLRWAWGNNPIDTTGATVAEYEQRRLAREAEEKRQEAEEKRAYDKKVIKTDIEKRTIEYNRTSVPIIRTEERSRRVWDGTVGKWLGQKKTEYSTEQVHVGNTVTIFKREEQRTVETLGSGKVVYGDWTTVREWQERQGSLQSEHPDQGPSVPSSPVAVKADNVKATSMTISWQPPHNTSGIMIRGYQVSYTCTPLGKSECLHNVDGNTTSTELTSLEPHTEYTIFVRAKTVDFGMYSTPITISTLDDDYSIPDDIKDVCCDLYTIQLNEDGCTHNNECHGFSIDFPPGVLLPNQSITLTIGVMAYGPFQFPKDVQPISPILWVCGDTADVKLLKDAQVTLPHYLDIGNNDDREFGIVFLKSIIKHRPVLESEKQRYTFEKMANAAVLKDHKATLFTNHFCCLCLAADVSESVKEKSEYCMTLFSDNTEKFIFAVTYFLKTCIESLVQNFTHMNIVEQYDFKFNDSSNILNINYSASDVPEWMLTLVKGSEGIDLQDLDFWKINFDTLKLKVERRLYPPSFVLHYHALYDTRLQKTNILVSFSGTRLKIELPLIFHGGDSGAKNGVGVVDRRGSKGDKGGSGGGGGAVGGGAGGGGAVGGDARGGRGGARGGGNGDFSNVFDYCLGEENLIDVMEEGIDVAPKWMLLGLALRLSPQELDTIKETNYNQPADCLAYMLRAWLQQRYDTRTFGEPSWRLLCQAIHNPAGGNNPGLAKKIAERHLQN